MQSENIRIEDVLAVVAGAVRPLGQERLPLGEVSGRTLGEDISAAYDVPGFDNSAMDGYAIREADLGEGGRGGFTVVEEVPAGNVPERTVGPGEAVFIMTGAPMPEGADFVVPVEYTDRKAGQVTVTGYEGRANVRFAGEISRKGDTLLKSGTYLGPGEIALLASNGLGQVPVSHRPRVTVLSTGDELLLPGAPPQPGKIWACNALALSDLAGAYGATVTDLGILSDDLAFIRDAMASAGGKADVVISSGGASVGEWDHVRQAITDLCPRSYIWQVNMRPGRPLVFGERDGTLFFGLPGNPVAVMVSFYQFVRTALLALQGRLPRDIPVVEAVLDEPVRKRPGIIHFVRVILDYQDGAYHARTTGPQGSAVINSMATAHALLVVGPDQTEYGQGDRVKAQLLDFKPCVG